MPEPKQLLLANSPFLQNMQQSLVLDYTALQLTAETEQRAPVLASIPLLEKKQLPSPVNAVPQLTVAPERRVPVLSSYHWSLPEQHLAPESFVLSLYVEPMLSKPLRNSPVS